MAPHPITRDDVPEILQGLPARISDVLKPWIESSPDQPALVEGTGTWTYRQLSEAVDQTRNWLLDLGVRPGDRVMIVCENCRVFIAILLATASVDAWPVLVNARLAAHEVDAIRNHCGPRRVLYTTAISPHARDHAKRHGAVTQEIPGVGQIGIGAQNDEAETEPVETNVADRVAALIYTSGTTGLPKGVMLTHRNLLFVAAVSARIRSLTRQDRLYGVLPMSHAVGLSVVLLGTLLTGATLYVSSRFDPVAALKALEKDELTVLLGAPAMFSLLLDYAKLKNLRSLRFPKLRIISSSGAPLHPPAKSAVEALFGMVLHNGYGITECSPNIAQTRIETPRTDVSVGQVFPGIEVRIVGPDARPVTEGEVGELHVRGPNIMKGYYHSPEETAVAIDSDGWFNARDLARMEDDHLFIVGRTKDLIVHFGLNVYPAEVEAVLNSHPAVVRSAVVGRAVEGPAGDEQVIAFVQPSLGSSLTETEIADHAARHLAAYKRPSQIVFVATMPLTPTGKVVKGELAKMMQTAPTH